jgi:carbonic anhydrase
MQNIDPVATLIQRNHDFASHQFVASQSLLPTLRTMIVSCVDPRVDPASVLGIAQGEAIVIRKVGGRITPAMGILQMISRAHGMQTGVSLSVVVLHHTDCGITRLQRELNTLAHYFGVVSSEVEGKQSAIPISQLPSMPRH